MNISKLVNNEDFIPIRFLRVCHEFSFMVSLAGNPVFSGLTEVWSGVDLFRMRNGVCLLRRVYFRRIFPEPEKKEGGIPDEECRLSDGLPDCVARQRIPWFIPW